MHTHQRKKLSNREDPHRSTYCCHPQGKNSPRTLFFLPKPTKVCNQNCYYYTSQIELNILLTFNIWSIWLPIFWLSSHKVPFHLLALLWLSRAMCLVLSNESWKWCHFPTRAGVYVRTSTAFPLPPQLAISQLGTLSASTRSLWSRLPATHRNMRENKPCSPPEF